VAGAELESEKGYSIGHSPGPVVIHT